MSLSPFTGVARLSVTYFCARLLAFVMPFLSRFPFTPAVRNVCPCWKISFARMQVAVVPSPASLLVSSDADLMTESAMKSDSVSGSVIERRTEIPSFVILQFLPLMSMTLCPYGPAVWDTISDIFYADFFIARRTSSVFSFIVVQYFSLSIVE